MILEVGGFTFVQSKCMNEVRSCIRTVYSNVGVKIVVVKLILNSRAL